MRRIGGVLVAALALAVGAVASRAVEISRVKAVRVETERAASAAVQRAAEGLAAVVTDLKLKVENAAANPRLVFALQGNVDERTMRDLWRTEEWWRPWRTEFKVYAVAVTGVELDVVEGIEAADLDSVSLLRHVRAHGEGAAEIVVGKGWPYAAAATAVRVPGREKSPLLLLAKPLDQPVLRRLADKSGGAVILTNGRTSLIDAGPEAERTLLGRALGSERNGGTFYPPDGSWGAVSTAVGPGLWLWAFASATAAAHDANEGATERKSMLWIAAVLIAGAALLAAFRRSGDRGAAQAAGAATVLGSTGAGSTQGGWPVPAGPGSGASESPGITAAIPPSPLSPFTTPPALAARTGELVGSGAAASSSRGIDGSAATAMASSPPPPSASKAQFGRYTLLDRLGEGGMAEVYTAVTFGAEGFRRKFVVKRLRAELSREPAAVDQFIDEANLASSMVHSNIVPVFDFGKVGEEFFMAQEYILGRDLARVTRRRMERDGVPLPPAVVLHAAQETLRALEYAHTKTNEHGQPLDIVHRDVSPANVIVSARGEVKLFDFGIVKAEGRVTKTESGIVKGNVTFMSPEQARGVSVDARADLFSLGLTLYYCLTGHVLYTGATTYELLVKAATGPGPAEQSQFEALPEPCGALLRRALQVLPEDRFQTAREFSDAIAGHVAGGAAQLAQLMHHLFSDDFRVEEARFRAVDPTPPSAPTVPSTPAASS